MHAPCGSGGQGESGASDSVSRPCMLRAGLALRERVGRVTLSRDHAPCGSGAQGESGASDSVSRPCSVRVWRSGREWGE